MNQSSPCRQSGMSPGDVRHQTHICGLMFERRTTHDKAAANAELPGSYAVDPQHVAYALTLHGGHLSARFCFIQQFNVGL